MVFARSAPPSSCTTGGRFEANVETACGYYTEPCSSVLSDTEVVGNRSNLPYHHHSVKFSRVKTRTATILARTLPHEVHTGRRTLPTLHSYQSSHWEVGPAQAEVSVISLYSA